jgi:hypothetical protein
MGAIEALIGLLSGGAGKTVGGWITNIGALVALAPLGLWFANNKDDVVTVITYGDLALYGLFVFALLKVAHYTRAGREAA